MARLKVNQQADSLNNEVITSLLLFHLSLVLGSGHSTAVDSMPETKTFWVQVFFYHSALLVEYP